MLVLIDHDRPQLFGIIRGLNYLHTRGVVHGDLKGVRTISSPTPCII
jgi:serine/threonine protein kinase